MSVSSRKKTERSGSSCESVKSDHSMDIKDGDPTFPLRKRKNVSVPEPGPSCESKKSDQSMEQPFHFKAGGPSVKLRKRKNVSGPEPGPSCESVQSDQSMEQPFHFKAEGPSVKLRKRKNVSGPEPGPSCESMKSDQSMEQPFHFKAGGPSVKLSKERPEFSCESVKSDWSMNPPLFFKDGGRSVDSRKPGTEEPIDQPQSQLDPIFMGLEETILTFVKKELKRFYEVLRSHYPESLVNEDDEEHSSREAFLKITLDFLRRMKQEQLAERLQNNTPAAVCRTKVKSCLQQRFSCVFEGIAKAGNPTLLNEIYTELYITEGGAAGVNQEHEIRHIENAFRKPSSPETTIRCEDIFKGPTHRQGPIGAELTAGQGPVRTVLTKGVAGIGKTVLTQKFSLDWAEGRANQDFQLLFPFTFRELNMLRDTQLSLMGLLHHCFSESAGLCSFEDLQVVFIFDGLDECRLSLDFTKTPVLTEITESVSVDVLLVNLIRGTLLPSARLWITTRPAAANQIPAECVSMVTEVRGFTNSQKEQYLRKRFRNKLQATAVISHIRTSRSLHIMCHIPVFCWILSTVLRHMMKTRARNQLPQTLTQMYIHFLVVQAKVKSWKYDGRSETDPHWSPETRKLVESLGKLAFEQLQKGNLIFYESDLNESGLDAAAASMYSGVFTQLFREEPGLYQDKVYCFIHLSVQEFLAALYAHLTFFTSGVNLLSTKQTSGSPESVAKFYQSAVDQALQSPNGHLDLFLRFLLGLSLQTNQSLLHGLLTQKGSSSRTNQVTAKYIKEMLNKGLSVERSINLFHCLNELNDQSLVEAIQQVMREEGSLSKYMSPAQWSAVAFLLLCSDTDLEEFDLKNYSASENALLNLLPVVKVSNKAILSSCNLSQSSCGPLSSVLSSSSMTLLDLSNNDLQDSGVELLCSGLKSAPCRLETLCLSRCNLSQSSCGPLSSVLSSSILIHLDLSNNDLQDLGVKLLCSGLESAPCRLETLRLSGCLVSEEGVASLASALSSAFSHLRKLDLSYNYPGPTAKILIALQKNPHCPLNSLRLKPAGVRWMVPGLSKYYCKLTLDSKTAHSNLKLSKQNRKVTNAYDQSYPDHKDRFSHFPQVLCSTPQTGRCYWEVHCSKWGVDIAVSYRGIRRKGNSDCCCFGENDQSWCMRNLLGTASVCHNKRQIPVPSSSAVGVFLDSEAGSLSFYKVCNGKFFHLHTINTTFTEPLLLGFRLWDCGSSVTLVDVSKVLPDVPRI